ncbi:MAG: hypothetical protein Q8J97_03445, partial [Flavobacteriaceae bacterium]|nr:hypothetical protein [Flavobacteriaceae bacterium]
MLGVPQSLMAHRMGAKCLLEMCQWKECANYAERALECVKRLPADEVDKDAQVDCLCALARCTEATGGNVKRAAQLYREALEIEPLCAEAIDALIGHRLLPAAELLELINALQLPPDSEALRTLYKARLDGDAGGGTAVVGQLADGASGALTTEPPCVTLLRSAKYHYRRSNLRAALRSTTELLRLQPYSEDAVTVHLAILVDLRETSTLFAFAHELVDKRPHQALSLYAVGCYYYLLCSYERAGRFFSKATELAPAFPHAWIAYAHCYAQLEEGEQALSVYRRAQANFPGLHVCGVYLGMQYSRLS